MSDSESEEENFCFFGKPLEPYDEGSFPKKKPIYVEEQIATDAQGRRRFHGAFTGGFSAGFYNTVGSLEGWKPSEFKSTRQEKAKNKIQKPQDFMDDEDVGEYGIAHQTVRATSEFSTSKKRRRQVFSDGPIPGVPVLHSLLTSGNETVGYLLLKNIGIQDKVHLQHEELHNSDAAKVYGCQMPRNIDITKPITDKQYEIPVIYQECLKNPKVNTFGLGYEGLNKSHINLFQSTNLVVKEKNNKKLSIAGQAFGVGAFEDDDEDIYMKDDMTKYDFELTKEKKAKNTPASQLNLIFDNFVSSKTPLINKKMHPAPTIPHSFTGKHKIKKSRFEPIKEEVEEISRGDINPAIRAKYLGEESNKTYTASKAIPNTKMQEKVKPATNLKAENDKTVKKEITKNRFDLSAALVFDRFVSASQTEDISNILEPVNRSETEHGTKEMRDAAKMKMFGPLTRVTIEWYPSPLLCKRFNVPEPLIDKSELQKNRKRTKNLIFEYQKHEDVEASLKPGISTQMNEEIIPPDDKSCIEMLESNAIPIDEVMVSQSTNIVEATIDLTKTVKEDAENIDPTVLPTDITEKVDVEKKLDLFKAIFLSSSESEDEEDVPEVKNKISEEEKQERQEELKSNVLSDQLIPKIKPMKEGILSNVSFIKFTKPNKPEQVETPEVSSNNTSKTSEDNLGKVDLYGPRVPHNLPPMSNVSSITVSSSEDDAWVEKDKKSKKKNKHKKKHKKEKYGKKDKYEKKKK